jgi:hypothetical protein
VGSIVPAAALLLAGLQSSASFAQSSPVFVPGNLVVVVSGCGVYNGTCTSVPNGTGTGGGYGDNQGSPLTLFQFAPSGTSAATFVNSLTLPQAASGANLPVSGEYGSSSEGTIQLSGTGQFLTVMGYGINANTFNAAPATYGAAPSNALAQSGSLTGQSYTPVPRVVALIDANGNVDSSSVLFNVFNLNNPRSIFTQDGTVAYVSGQGASGDATSGVFYTPLKTTNNAPTPITGLDTTSNTVSQDTREVQIYNNTLYVSTDTKGGSNSARSYIGTLGTAGIPPTTTVGGPVMLTGVGNTGGTGKVTITTGANSNGNGGNSGLQINISPNNFFFANAYTLYVADSGNPKNNSATSQLGNGGLEKWINTKTDGTGTWNLAYTLYKGLGLVVNTSASGSTGLYALAGKVLGDGTVQLYATDYTLTDLDTTHLFGITDTVSYTTATQASAESFNVLATAPQDSNFKGVSFAPIIPAPVAPTITWPAPAAIAFGSALSDEQLDATASVPGTFTYTPAAGTVLPVGANQTLSVTFTPTDYITYKPVTATTTITVNAATPASLVVTKLLSRTGGNILVTVTIANTGGTAAENVTLTNVKVGAAVATPLPVLLGTIASGATASATVSVPGSVGAPGAASSLTLNGTFTGGSFSSSARITLP